jgi:uncharacterized protein (TIGR02271 family)
MRTVTAFYDSMADAQAAAATIVDAGVDRHSVRILDQSEADTSSAAAAGADQSTGFFAALRDLFVPDEDRHAYAEGIRRGGALVSASVDDSAVDRVVSLLDETGAVDIDARSESWRNEGWSGYQGTAAAPDLPAAAIHGGATAGAMAGGITSGATAGSSAANTDDATTATGRAENGPAASYGSSGGAATAGPGEDEMHVPVVEEQLRVGKREVGRGTVRVRSYVVETPVEQEVTLRNERVTIERRPVDRAVEDVPADAFQERSFELTETAEEAVVDKAARVKEELLLRKDLDERTRTIADTVRRTEVEVEDTRRQRDAAVDPARTTDDER